MKIDEFLLHIANGERWFNNGSKRSRYVVGVGAMVMYKNKPSSTSTTGVWAMNFAKWVKGVGCIDPNKSSYDSGNLKESSHE